MWNCGVCGSTSQAKQSLTCWPIHRIVKDRRTNLPRQEIACEVPACQRCLAKLRSGMPLAVARRVLRSRISLTPVVPIRTVVSRPTLPPATEVPELDGGLL